MYVGLFPEVAKANFGIANPTGDTYFFLYTAWGMGAALGALTVGTFLAHHSKAVVARWAPVGFAIPSSPWRPRGRARRTSATRTRTRTS